MLTDRVSGRTTLANSLREEQGIARRTAAPKALPRRDGLCDHHKRAFGWCILRAAAEPHFRASEKRRPMPEETSLAYELLVFTGDEPQAYPLPRTGSVTVGRAEDNDVCVMHPSVSRAHFALHVGAQLRIEDLGGANGTFVRDRRDPQEAAPSRTRRPLSGTIAEIAPGDCITFGNVMAVVRRVPERFSEADLGRAVVLDPVVRELYDQATQVAQASISVLILGETGVGKELLARAIHQRSPRAKAPFMGINCAALSESLFESELFGYEKGAFTGATQSRPGLLEAADGGSVFLDEIGELSLTIQVKLLRVLEERQVLRVGSRVPTDINVRFIAATNIDLEAAVAEGTFRKDLFFRLNGISLTLPPLRQRRGEIRALARLFGEQVCRELDRERLLLEDSVLEVLERHPWPGNIRELRNVIERAVVLCRGQSILPEHLPPELTNPSKPKSDPAPKSQPSPTSTTSPPAGQLREELRFFERERLLKALAQCNYNQTRAAALLGISRRTMVTRLTEYGLRRPRKDDES